MEKRLTGLVLKAVDYKETDKIVTLLTLEEGKATIKLRGVRSAKSKLRFASFPFFTGTFILTQTKTGFVVTGVDPINRYDYLTLDLKYFYLGTLILEIADKLSVDGYQDEELFNFIINKLESVKNVDETTEEAMFTIKQALDIAGHGLNTDYPENANGFSYDEGGLVNLSKTAGLRQSDGVIDSLKKLLKNEKVESKYIPQVLSLLSSYFFVKTTKKLLSVEQIILMSDLIS